MVCSLSVSLNDPYDLFLMLMLVKLLVLKAVLLNNLSVLILAPRGATVPCQVHNQNDGTVRVEYQVHEVGTHI